MNIQYASDLHMEFPRNSAHLAERPLDVAGDVLVLAGDITVWEDSTVWRHPFFDWCARNYRHTYIVPGNHEYYGGVELDSTLEELEIPVRENVSYANNKSVTIGDTELFLTTLWTRIAPGEEEAVARRLADCRLIVRKRHIFSPMDYAEVHGACADWLDNAVRASSARHKVVVSHHCPTLRVPDPRFPGSAINSAFCVDMDSFLVNSGIDYWIYGHTHYNGGAEFKIDNTTLLTNQMGYVGNNEHLTFRRSAVLTI